MKKITALLMTVLILATFGISVYAENYTVIVSPQYNMAETFEHTITKVSKNSKWALANTSGQPITGYEWEAMGDITSEYIPAKKGGLWGYISPTGSVLIPYKFTEVGYFKDGVAMAQQKDGTYVYINISGNVLFHSPFEYSFTPSEGAICGMINNLYGYCDTAGTMIIAPQFDMAFDFHEGYAAVKFGGKWGYITTYGQYSVRPTYDYAGDFKNGYAICRLNGKYGIIDANGNRTSSFDFDHIAPPDDEGRYPAKTGSFSGYIKSNGEWILKTDYDFCYKYTDGVARIYDNGKWGYIDTNGKVLVTPTFVDCGEYYNNRAPYSLDGTLWGYLTLPVTVVTEEPEPVVVPTPPAQPEDPTENEPTPSIPVVSPSAGYPLAPTKENCISMRINSTIAYNGSQRTDLTSAPVLLNGTTMIPVRNIVELFGGTVSWNAETKRVSLNWRHSSVSLTIGSKICYVNGVPGYLSATPVISADGATLVPLRSVADAFGCTVEWVASDQNIFIYY